MDFREQVGGQDAATGSLLYRSEAQFRRFMETLPAGAYVCDADGLITYYNPSAVKLWGRAPELNHPEDRFCGSFRLYAMDGAPIAHESCWMALALRDERPYLGQEIVVERPDGRLRAALAYANPMHDDDGRLLGATNVLVDITERKQAEEALARAHAGLEQRVRERTAELEALTRELDSFNYSVSHDLRSPLRGIDGFSRVLEEEYGDGLDEAGRGYLRRIRSGAARMGELIDALLGLSRVSTGGLRLEDFDLGEVAACIALALEERAPSRSMAFRIPRGLRVRADRALVGDALENLLGNAWKFTSERADAVIEVGHRELDGERVFFVRDNGVGFDMEFADRLFAAFQRLHAADRFEGTGIGLATVQRIVHRHGGRVWAEAEVGRGATFYFTLPDVPEGAA